MTDLRPVPVITPETALVAPHTGELINLEDPVSCARILEEIRNYERDLQEAKRLVTQALVEESRRQGSKTLRLDYMEVKVSGGEYTTYDPEVLEEGLRAAGLPEERIQDVVRQEVVTKVDGREAKRVAANNPAYAQVVDQARSVVESPWRVDIKVGKR